MKILLLAGALIVAVPVLAMLVAAADGYANRWRAPRLIASELADQIQALIDEEGWGHRDLYDELTCVPINKSPLERYRERLVAMANETPSDPQTWFTSAHKAELSRMVEELRRASVP